MRRGRLVAGSVSCATELRVAWVSNSWGKSSDEFRNEECPRTPIHEQLKTTSPGSFESSLPAGERRPPQELLAGGSLSDNGLLLSTKNGVDICQPAPRLPWIFLLSSLVRYRPEIWIHAMTRGTSSERLPDDHTISLLESFFGFVLGEADAGRKIASITYFRMDSVVPLARRAKKGRCRCFSVPQGWNICCPALRRKRHRDRAT